MFLVRSAIVFPNSFLELITLGLAELQPSVEYNLRLIVHLKPPARMTLTGFHGPWNFVALVAGPAELAQAGAMCVAQLSCRDGPLRVRHSPCIVSRLQCGASNLEIVWRDLALLTDFLEPDG